MFDVQSSQRQRPASARHEPSGVIDTLARLVDEMTGDARASPAVVSSLSLIARHYASRITLDDLAAHVGQTPFQLIRTFHRELGMTPHACIVRIRVLVATRLLEAGLTIAQAASDAGFVDQAHLTRHFKRLHATTPSRYLKRQETDRRAAASIRRRPPRAREPIIAAARGQMRRCSR